MWSSVMLCTSVAVLYVDLYQGKAAQLNPGKSFETRTVCLKIIQCLFLLFALV